MAPPAIGESLSPTDFRAFLDRFYRISSEAVLASNGIVDKFVGDEVIGLFFGGISGDRHAAAAVMAGRTLLARVGRADVTPTGPIPVGAGVHTGVAFVGSTATDGVVSDFTALGDVVNTTARLASQAASGQLLVSVEAATAAGADTTDLERRKVDVRGRTEPVEVVSFPITAEPIESHSELISARHRAAVPIGEASARLRAAVVGGTMQLRDGPSGGRRTGRLSRCDRRRSTGLSGGVARSRPSVDDEPEWGGAARDREGRAGARQRGPSNGEPLTFAAPASTTYKSPAVRRGRASNGRRPVGLGKGVRRRASACRPADA